MVAGFEGGGLLGMLAAGWLTDRVFGGRGARMCLFCMTMCGVTLALFWKIGGLSVWLSTGLLIASGFFIYGPQALVGISAANLATKRAAATAVGLTGIFGYASTVLSGWGLGLLVQRRGWDAAFVCLLVASACGVALFAMAWNAPADGYERGADGVRTGDTSSA
jgi:OPA family glycerol-3-phosphate transporter-like MFS transporter/OPA family sugar phosphate sensor protein UhpC-like MFS transporter